MDYPPEDRSKALNEYMSSGFAPRADIVAACRHVRFVPTAEMRDRDQDAETVLAALRMTSRTTPGFDSMGT
jgi:hypothetical protein